MSNKTDEYSFDWLVDAICTRPKMFTMNGTFGEVVAYLEGFAAGIAVGNADLGKEWISGPRLASEWVDFSREWLRRKLHYPPNLCWDGVLWRRYPDDQEALERLRLLFLRFKAENDS